MSFKLKIFETAVAGQLSVQSPADWPISLVFHLRRPGSKAHLREQQERARKSPVLAAVLPEMMKNQFRNAREERRRKLLPKTVSPPEVEVVGADSPSPVDAQPVVVLSAEEQTQERYEEAIEKALDNGSLDASELTASDDDVAPLLSLLTGLSVNGVMQPMADGDWITLLQDEDIVPEGRTYAGMELGAALVKHINDYLETMVVAKNEVLEEAVGN